MTSKKSSNKVYRHTFKRAFKDALPAGIICLMVMIVLIPISTIIIPDESILSLDYTHHQMKYRFFYESLHPFVNGMAVFTGFIIAMALFKFMLVKRYSDVYFSFGIRRRKLLFIKSIAGFIHIVIAVFVPMIISLIINLIEFGSIEYNNVVYGDVAIAGFEYMSFGLLALALAGFSITILAMCLSGTLKESIVYSAVLIASPSMILYSINALAENLLFGSAFGESADGLLDSLSYLNPVYFFWDTSVDYNLQQERFDGYELPDMEWKTVIGWLLASFVILFATSFVLEKRKVEVAGVSGKCKVMKFMTPLLIGFTAYSLALNYSYDIGGKLSILISIISFLVIYFAIEKIQLQGFFKGIFKLPIQLGSILAVTLILVTGGLGYSSRIPDVSDIVSVTMSYVGSPNYINGQPEGTSDGSQYYVETSYTFETESDIETVTELHQALIDAGKGSLTLSSGDFSETTVPYDITVCYTLSDGTTLTRYYDRTTYAVLEQMLELDDTDEVQEEMQETILDGDSLYYSSGAFSSGTIYINNSYFTDAQELIIDDDSREELLECIAEDVANQSTEDRYFPDEDAIGVVMFTLSDSTDSLTFGYNFDNAVVYLTSEFTNTLEFFEEAGLSSYFEFTGEVESINIEAYSPYVSIVNTDVDPVSAFFMGYITDTSGDFIQTKDFGGDLEITDEDEIDELLSLVRSDYYMSEGGYLVEIKIEGEDQYVYKFLPADLAPDYVINQLQ